MWLVAALLDSAALKDIFSCFCEMYKVTPFSVSHIKSPAESTLSGREYKEPSCLTHLKNKRWQQTRLVEGKGIDDI